MKNFTKKLVSASVLLGCSLVANTAQAQSSVWQVSKGDDSLFIGGTVHILPKALGKICTVPPINNESSPLLTCHTEL